MRYTLGTAAKAAGVGKATISRAIASGKLSAERTPGGTFAIEASELHRVFPPPPPPDRVMERIETPETPLRNGADLAAVLGREREQLLATIADLRTRLDESERERREQAARIVALLSDQRSTAPATPIAPAPTRRSWLPWRRRG